MRNILPLPTRQETVPPEWLQTAREEMKDRLRNLLTGSGVFSAFAVTGVVKDTKPSTMLIKIEKLIIDGKVTLVDDEGKPLKKVVSSDDYDCEDESLLEQWKESYENDDYEYDSYDDDMYEGQGILDKLQVICDNLDIKVRGRKNK
ncbi:hypothetical protein Tco_0511606 [Tanacetum coccineum]